MEKCSLCKINDADKTGSHLLTHSLIKSAFNESGSTKRDKEIAFEITGGKKVSTEVYFGRSVSVDSIQEILKDKIEKFDIDQNVNSLVQDYLFCTPCEKRFTIIEDVFISDIYKPLQERSVTTFNDSMQNKLVSYTVEEEYIIRLFYYIQMWRMSVSKDIFKLSPEFEEKLRKIIDNCLKDNIAVTLDNCQRANSELTKYPISVTFLETDIFSEDKFELTTNMIHLFPFSKMPYFGLLNDNIVTLYEKESHLRSTPKHLFGFMDMINKSEHINIPNNKFKVGILNDKKRQNIVSEVGMMLIKDLKETWRRNIISMHYECFNSKPSEYLIKKILSEIGDLEFFTVNNDNTDDILQIIHKNFVALVSKK